MKCVLLAISLAAVLSATPVPARKPVVAELPPCSSRATPAGFAYPVPGLEELLAPEQLDPAYATSCRLTAAVAAQRFGERLQAALRGIWPQSGPAVLAMVERVNVASPAPALVKFCFVGVGETGGQEIACGEVVFRLAKEELELRLAGREAVTSAQVPAIRDLRTR